jgi:outer membrane protein assembly factor BamB
LPVFGSAVVKDGQVFFGIGNGKLTRSAPNPAGALVCLDADTGKQQWRYDVGDAVLSAPAMIGDAVVFGSRDHHCYCLHRHGGGLLWRTDLGSPMVAASEAMEKNLYAIGSGGIIHCLEPTKGLILWRFDMGKHFRATPEIVAAPALAIVNDRIRLYVGAGLDYSISSAAVLCCLEAPPDGGI